MPERTPQLWYQYRWQLLVGFLGVILFLLGLISMRLGGLYSSSEFEVVESGESGEVVVEVSGAVNDPGVYMLQIGSRIEDAINMAGGFSGDVNAEYVEKMINRAALVNDGQKIYIPMIDDTTAGAANQSGGASANNVDGAVGGMTGEFRQINVNTASKSELESLWGIGPVTAQNVIDNRPYSTAKELLDRGILKSNVYERNIDSLTVY